MKRNAVIVLLVLALLCMFSACKGKNENSQSDSGNKFSGVMVNALIFKSLDTDYIIENLAPRLKQETGINLVVNQVPYEEVRAAQLTDARGAKKYDIVNPCTEWSYEYRNFSAPLDEHIGKADYPLEEEDLIQFVYQAFNPTGKKYFIPYQPDTRIFFYRKDLLEKEGLSVPKTWAELLNAAKKLTKDTNGDGKIDQYGFTFSAARGMGFGAVKG